MKLLFGGLIIVACASMIGYFLTNGQVKTAILTGIVAAIMVFGGIIAKTGWDKPQGDLLKDIINKQGEDIKIIKDYLLNYENTTGSKLNSEYPEGHKIFALTKNNTVVQNQNVSDKIQTDWNRVIAKDTGSAVEIKIPYLKFMNTTFNNATILLPRKVGASINILGTPKGILYAKVLEINNNNIIAVLGIKK